MQALDRKRILIFLALAYGIAWAAGLAIALTGGLTNSPELAPGIPLALVLTAGVYMWAPALAHILTRVSTREGWGESGLRPHFRRGWHYWLAAWFLPALLTIVGGAIFFALFPRYFDPSLGMVQQILATYGVAGSITPPLFVLAQLFNGIVAGPIINSLFTFGEEFGWRGYLLPKLLPLGERRAILISGLIWGAWHWPVIAMGHNYGFDYPGAPWTGLLMMVWFTLLVGAALSWMTLRAGSVWPAVIGHAAVNAITGLPALFMQGQPSTLLGPMSTGVVGSLGWAALAAWILWTAKDNSQFTPHLTNHLPDPPDRV